MQQIQMTLLKKTAAMLGAALISLAASGCSGVEEPVSEELPELMIGCDTYAPYSFIDENGDFSGLDIELAQEACRRIGYAPSFTRVIWDEKDALLAEGSIDCLWSCFSMNGREDQYNWAGPYLNSRHVVAVCDESDIINLEDLEGVRVAVQSGTRSEELFLNHLNGLPEIGNLFCFTDQHDVAAALRKGYVEAIAGHEAVISDYIIESSDDFRILDECIQQSNLGVAFLKERGDGLPEKLNDALKEMITDGTAAQIVEKYGLDPEKGLGGILLAQD